MKNKIILLSGLIATSYFFAQEKVVPGKKDMNAQFVRIEQSAIEFRGKPMVYNENSKNFSDAEGVLLHVEKDKKGFESHRFQQSINGIPVEYGMMTVQVKNGKVVGTNSDWVKVLPKGLEKKASLSENIALNNALAYVGAQSYKWQDAEEEDFIKKDQNDSKASFYPKGKLTYFSDPQGENPSQLTLAYKFDIYASQPLSRQEVFVDAKTGTVLGTNALIYHANTPGTAITAYSGTQAITTDFTGTTYRLRETGRGGGTAVETYNLKQGTSYSRAVDFTDADNTWNNVNTSKDQYATDAHWGAEKTIDYLWTKFNRKSINNANFAIKSYVHYSRNYFNAFWDGQRMIYGDGSSTNGNKPLTSLDVCAHEIGHGMTSFSANLAYNKESGALNEGFSDILGNSVEFSQRPTKASWKLGEDFSYVIRDMANPNAYRQPDTYGGTYWVNVVGCTPTGGATGNDYCGVHTNSGVLNFWYYLLVQGGSGTNDKGFAYNVTGIGLDKAAQIAYRTLTSYLTSASTYANARTSSIQAATDLYGSANNEVTQVTNAWNAVGVGGGTSPAGVMAVASTTTYAVGPNPATDRFTVSFDETQARNNSIELVHSSGSKVLSTNYASVKGANKAEIMIPANAPSGVYFVMVNGEKVTSLIKK